MNIFSGDIGSLNQQGMEKKTDGIFGLTTAQHFVMSPFFLCREKSLLIFNLKFLAIEVKSNQQATVWWHLTAKIFPIHKQDYQG